MGPSPSPTLLIFYQHATASGLRESFRAPDSSIAAPGGATRMDRHSDSSVTDSSPPPPQRRKAAGAPEGTGALLCSSLIQLSRVRSRRVLTVHRHSEKQSADTSAVWMQRRSFHFPHSTFYAGARIECLIQLSISDGRKPYRWPPHKTTS